MVVIFPGGFLSRALQGIPEMTMGLSCPVCDAEDSGVRVGGGGKS